MRGSAKEKPLFEDGARPTDIQQGRSGDCWMLASLSAIARTPAGREWLKAVITDNHDGTYTVHFKNGEDVTVDDSSDILGRNASSGEDKWVLIIEKAFAKRHGGLESQYMHGNWPEEGLADLGLVSDHKYVQHFQDQSELISDADLRVLLKSGDPVVATADLHRLHGLQWNNGYRPEEHNFKPQLHSFSVVDATGDNVTLRNPWGHNDHLKLDGVSLQNDGTFTISLSEFRRVFFRVDYAELS